MATITVFHFFTNYLKKEIISFHICSFIILEVDPWAQLAAIIDVLAVFCFILYKALMSLFTFMFYLECNFFMYPTYYFLQYFTLTHLGLIFLSWRNQLIDIFCKSCDWFLYDETNGFKFVVWYLTVKDM